MYLIDSHCHLFDDRYNKTNKKVIENAIENNVKKMINCGTSLDDWNKIVAQKNEFPEYIIPAFGFHPWYINDYIENKKWPDQLVNYLQQYNGIVGEIGLDRSLNWIDNGKFQEYFFITQLEIAKSLNKAVSVHCRKTFDRLIPIIKSVKINPDKIIIHSFSGSIHTLNELLTLGVNISFSCSIINKNNSRIKDVVNNCPLDKILTETDSPDIYPPDFKIANKIQLNTPSNVKLVVEEISKIKNIEETIIIDKIECNLKRII